MPTLKAIKDLLHRQLRRRVTEFPLEDLDRLFAVREDMNVEDRKIIVHELYEYLRNLNRHIALLGEGMDMVASGNAWGVAKQVLTTAAGNLETAANSNDTLITLSETDLEFDWLDPRRYTNITIAVDRGTPQSVFLMDHRHNITAFSANYSGGWSLQGRTSIFMPVDGFPKKLRLWQFEADGTLDTVTIPTGREITLWQAIPTILGELT